MKYRTNMYQIIIHKIVERLSSKTNKKLFAYRVIQLNAKPQYIVQNVIWVRIPLGKEKTNYDTNEKLGSSFWKIYQKVASSESRNKFLGSF